MHTHTTHKEFLLLCCAVLYGTKSWSRTKYNTIQYDAAENSTEENGATGRTARSGSPEIGCVQRVVQRIGHAVIDSPRRGHSASRAAPHPSRLFTLCIILYCTALHCTVPSNFHSQFLCGPSPSRPVPIPFSSRALHCICPPTADLTSHLSLAVRRGAR